VTVSILGCVVNGPGEARETMVGITGGGSDNHKVYIGGSPDHNIDGGSMVDHIVELVEQRAAAIEAAKSKES
jgi:(E)-4-hydroxy-3-methylbut-2-enyl-diphosphate synthase